MKAIGRSSEMLLLPGGDEIAQMPKLHLIPSRYWIDRNKVLDVSIRIIANSRPDMKALVLNAPGRGFDFDDVEIAAPRGREVLVDVHASGLCHTDLLFATHDIVPTPRGAGSRGRSWA
jgi:hypothetical protein